MHKKSKAQKQLSRILDPRKKTLAVKVYGRGQRPDHGSIVQKTIRAALLRTRYPKAAYPPDPACRFCQGYGEVKKFTAFKPCICIFVEHAAIPACLAALQKLADSPEEMQKTLQAAGLEDWGKENPNGYTDLVAKK